jgi:4-amino-4-deoxy-L-arabinose transferase-like glycosyltransferase
LNHPPLPSTPPRDWDRLFRGLLLGVVAFRLVYLFFFVREFDLAGDEAYYWDWGRRLDWGYFSKPPMIGWLMGLAGRLSGNEEWALRLAPLVLGTFSLIAIQRLARAMFDARAAFLAALLVVLTPGNAALNLLFTIDAPLVLTWTLALLFFWRAVEKPASWTGWLWLAMAIGLGSLSKQMMLVFPVLMVVFAAISPQDRALLRNARMWTAIVIGAAFLAPVLIWQQANGWPTLSHMKEHFEVGNPAASAPPGLAQHASWFFQFPLIQAALYSPVTWLVMILVLVAAVRAWKSLDRRAALLVVFSAPALAVFYLMALRQDVHANWPAVFYIAAFVLTAACINGAACGFSISEKWRRWGRIGVGIGLGMTLMTYIFPLLSRPAGLAGHDALDPFARLRGWKEAGARQGEFLKNVPHPERTFVVVFGHRHYASEAAFYMPQQPRVYRWQADGRRMSQYELWPAPGVDKEGWDALLFYPNSDQKFMTPSVFFRRSFTETNKLGDIDVPVGHGERRSYQVFLCKALGKWPDPIPVQIERDPGLKQFLETKDPTP